MFVHKHVHALAAALALCLLSACSSSEPPKSAAPAAEPKAAQPKIDEAPALFKVKFTTSKGPIVVEVHKDWAPIGAQRFYELVKAGYYDGDRFFRIVPKFVVQFGLAADPAVTARWNKPIPDDPVMQTNKPGTLVYATAGKNTRTTQLFINLVNNQRLDADGFAPFAIVLEGMDVVARLYPGYAEQPEQDQIEQHGNSYLNEKFPKLDYIQKAEIL